MRLILLFIVFMVIQKRPPKPKPESVYMLEPRRSSRVRNSVASYCDEVSIYVFHLLATEDLRM